MHRLYGISASDDHCVVATSQGEDTEPSQQQQGNSPLYTLSLCNSLGTSVDTKHISIEPLFVCMSSNYVFSSSRDQFYIWHFRTAQTWTTRLDSASAASGNKAAGSRANRREQIYHVDDTPTGNSQVIRPIKI